MDTTLVVCYSLTGTSRKLADLVCAQQGWPMGILSERHSRLGVRGTLRCVADSMFHLKPAFVYEGPDPADFRTVVLVAPVWIGQLASPMRAFVAAFRDRLRHVAVLTTMGQKGGSNAAAEVARLLGAEPILAASIASREVDDGSCASAAQAFGDALRPPRAPLPVRESILSPVAV